MNMDKVIVQRLRSVNDSYALAEKYYAILSAINGLKLTQREIQLVAFTAVKGNMSYANVREEFCRKYETTTPTINNIISKLKKIGLLTKVDGKVKVNPVVQLNLNLDVTLDIKLVHG